MKGFQAFFLDTTFGGGAFNVQELKSVWTVDNQAVWHQVLELTADNTN